ncbi:MAG: PA0069 family radical SAM protein [Flavobacteriales bacterium]
MKSHQKGQGAQINPDNRFFEQRKERIGEYLDYLEAEGEQESNDTKFVEVFPKTIVNKVPSPDVGMDWSMNPYQGCEHGCSYCYARNTHEYWGYSAGIDFERTILVKKNSPQLLEEKLLSKNWKAATIVMSGNTDCYQPAERRFQITRQCLEVFWKYRHPVGIITKNALIQRDLDIIEKLASENLIMVVVSVTTLDEDLRRVMEPRTASAARRLQTIEKLTKAGVPVMAMIAPIIPGLNSHEVFDLMNAVKEAGAVDAGYTMVRLNGQIGDIFSDWVQRTHPDRAEKILNHIKSAHHGQLNDNEFGRRMKGEGKMAEQIRDSFKLAKRKAFGETKRITLNTNLHDQYKSGQFTLF